MPCLPSEVLVSHPLLLPAGMGTLCCDILGDALGQESGGACCCRTTVSRQAHSGGTAGRAGSPLLLAWEEGENPSGRGQASSTWRASCSQRPLQAPRNRGLLLILRGAPVSLSWLQSSSTRPKHYGSVWLGGLGFTLPPLMDLDGPGHSSEGGWWPHHFLSTYCVPDTVQCNSLMMR